MPDNDVIVLEDARDAVFTLEKEYRRALRNGVLNMAVLVVLSVGTGYVFSVGSTFFYPGVQFYEAVAVLLVFILLGHWLEMRARAGANDAVRALLELAPPKATVIRNGQEIEIPTAEVQAGDEQRHRHLGRGDLVAARQNKIFQWSERFVEIVDMGFQRADTPKSGKNRMHVDLATRDPAAEVRRREVQQRGLFGNGAAVGEYGPSMALQFDVVEKAEGLTELHERMRAEPGLLHAPLERLLGVLLLLGVDRQTERVAGLRLTYGHEGRIWRVAGFERR